MQSSLMKKDTFLHRCIKQKYLILMVLPGFLLLFIFKYFPMYGVLIAFKDYNIAEGIFKSPWAGLKHFIVFFESPMSWRIIKNTLLLGIFSLLVGFPAPIIFALLLNELRIKFFKRMVQTITYFPHFLSTVIVVGFVLDFSSMEGIFNKFLAVFGVDPKPLLNFSEYFRPLFIGSSVWQNLGYGAIIYLAALTGVDMTLYEAADMDGATRWQKMKHVTWPAIIPATTVLLIMNLGNVLSTDYQKVLLMYNSGIYETADIIDTYVYRMGILSSQYEYSAAVGLMLAVIGLVLITSANYISRKISDNSLW